MAKSQQMSPEEATAIKERMFQNWKRSYEEYRKMSDEERLSTKGQALKFQVEDMDENIRAEYQQRLERERQEKEKEKKGLEGSSYEFGMELLREKDKRDEKEYKKKRKGLARGGSQLLVPVEMQDELPSRDLPPEESEISSILGGDPLTALEAAQEPDAQMEMEYIDYVVDTALDESEQNYLMGALEGDPKLSNIFDKVVETASEFTGDGPVEGPGTGLSDSIPARLSDGEFVMTKEATDEIGADNLERLMRDAENGEIRRTSYGGGLQEYAFGGLARDDEKSLLEDDEEEIRKQMISANRMPSVI